MSQPESLQQPSQCLNCSATLEGPYCYQCGQKHKPHRESFWHIFIHFTGDFLHFDSKVFRTFRPLLFRPGQLARDYVEGKRVRYLDPIRMYVFLSIVFFFLFFWSNKQDTQPAGETMTEVSTDSLSSGDKTDTLSLPPLSRSDSTLADSVVTQHTVDTLLRTAPWDSLIADTSSHRQGPQTVAEYRRQQDSLPAAERDGIMRRSFQEKVLRLQDAANKDSSEMVERLSETFMKNLPKLLFLLLPFIALILKLLYIRRRVYYTDHFFFMVFFYCFVFTVYSVTIPLDHWLRLGLGNWMILGSMIYLLLAMKRFYGQSWARTVVKMCLLLMISFVVLLVAVIINAAVSLLMIN